MASLLSVAGRVDLNLGFIPPGFNKKI
jgi:hypothetical protein